MIMSLMAHLIMPLMVHLIIVEGDFLSLPDELNAPAKEEREKSGHCLINMDELSKIQQKEMTAHIRAFLAYDDAEQTKVKEQAKGLGMEAKKVRHP
eukprot:14673572-Ditylum_brightwellii.AAC.1